MSDYIIFTAFWLGSTALLVGLLVLAYNLTTETYLNRRRRVLVSKLVLNQDEILSDSVAILVMNKKTGKIVETFVGNYRLSSDRDNWEYIGRV